MKKLLLGLAASCIFTTMLMGCSNNTDSTGDQSGGSQSSSGVVTLTMYTWGGDPDNETYRARLDLFEAQNPNIKVELTTVPTDYETKVQTMMAGGTAPDIVQMAETVFTFGNKNQVIDLTDYINKDGLNLEDRFGSAVNLYNIKGKQFALPDRGGNMINFYNKDMFDAAGVEYPTGDWTWADYLEACEKLTIKDDSGKTIQYATTAVGSWTATWLPFIYQNGGSIVDVNGNPTLNTPENIEWLSMWVEMVEKGYTPTAEEFADLGIGGDALFAQGKVAMNWTGFWLVSSLLEFPELNWDMAVPPMNKVASVMPFFSGLGITEGSKHKDEAWEVIKFLTMTDEGQMPIVTNKQDIAAAKSVLESDALLKDYVDKDVNMSVFSEASSHLTALPTEVWYSEMVSALGAQIDEMLKGNMTPEECAAKLQEEAERVLANY